MAKPLPAYNSAVRYTVQDVISWIAENKFSSDCVKKFREACVDGNKLLHMTSSDLQQIEVNRNDESQILKLVGMVAKPNEKRGPRGGHNQNNISSHNHVQEREEKEGAEQEQRVAEEKEYQEKIARFEEIARKQREREREYEELEEKKREEMRREGARGPARDRDAGPSGGDGPPKERGAWRPSGFGGWREREKEKHDAWRKGGDGADGEERTEPRGGGEERLRDERPAGGGGGGWRERGKARERGDRFRNDRGPPARGGARDEERGAWRDRGAPHREDRPPTDDRPRDSWLDREVVGPPRVRCFDNRYIRGGEGEDRFRRGGHRDEESTQPLSLKIPSAVPSIDKGDNSISPSQTRMSPIIVLPASPGDQSSYELDLSPFATLTRQQTIGESDAPIGQSHSLVRPTTESTQPLSLKIPSAVPSIDKGDNPISPSQTILSPRIVLPASPGERDVGRQQLPAPPAGSNSRAQPAPGPPIPRRPMPIEEDYEESAPLSQFGKSAAPLPTHGREPTPLPPESRRLPPRAGRPPPVVPQEPGEICEEVDSEPKPAPLPRRPLRPRGPMPSPQQNLQQEVQRVIVGDKDEYRPASDMIVIAKDYVSDVPDNHLSVYRGEVIYLLEECEQGEWKAKTNDRNGLININNVSKIDLNTLRKAPQIVTADLLPYCLSGTFSIFLEAGEAHFIYNKHGVFSKEKIDITGCSSKEIIDRLQKFIWKNQTKFRFYIDDASAVYCNLFLNSNRHINKHGRLAPYIPDWYHGYIGKEQTETILDGKQFGTFIVRKDNHKQKYIMSVTDGNVIHHIPIDEQGGQVVCCRTTRKYESVTDLVEHCFASPFSLDTGDEVRLKRYISRYDKDVPDGFSTLDPYWTELYLQTLSEGTEKQTSIRLMIVGHEKVGKTTLFRNLMGISREGIDSTDGIDVHINTCKVGDDKKWTTAVTSFGESERIIKIMQSNQNPDPRSKLKPSSRKNENEAKCDESIHIPDNSPEEITKQNTKKKIQEASGKDTMSEDISSRHHIEVDDTSRNQGIVIPTENASKIIALSRSVDKSADIIVSIWDFAGQYIYYATHQLFHSPRAVYLLVLDLSKGFEEQVEYGNPLGTTDAKRDVQSFIKFWVQSIHSSVGSKSGEPPVILVGTHKDKIEELGKSSDEHSETYFENVRQLFDNTPLLSHIQSEQFFFDNLAMNKTSLDKLKSTIIELATQQSYWNQEYPARWVTLEYALKEVQKPYLSFSKVCEINSKSNVPIVIKDEIRLFLMYQHFQGNVVYFNENELKDIVVLDPQWLIDAFKSIFTSRRFCNRQVRLRDQRKHFEATGVLTNELIEEVWKNDDKNDFFLDRHIILKFFVRLGIMSRCRTFDDKNEEPNDYHVPSLLPWLQSEKTIDNVIADATATDLVLVFQFESSYTSPTIYHKTTAAAMGRWLVVKSCGTRILYGNVGMYRLDMQHVGLTRLTDSTIELSVYNINREPIKCEVGDGFRRFIANAIDHELNRLQPTNTPQFETAFRCKCTKKCCHEIISIKDLEENNKMPCLQSAPTHHIDSRKAYNEWYVDVYTPKSENGKTTLGDAKLGKLAKAVTLNWELLGISLGIPENEIKMIKEQHPYLEAQKQHMFRAWKRLAGDSATIEAFLDEMKLNPKVEINWDIVKDVMDTCETAVKELY